MSTTRRSRIVRQSLACLTALAGAVFIGTAHAAIIPVTNPGFTATLDQATTFNAVNYNAGDPIPPGTLVSGSGAGLTLLDYHAGTAVGGTASFLGWVAQDGRAGVINPTEVTSGSTNRGNVGFLTTWTNGDDGITQLTQDLGIALLPNTTYVLSIQLLKKDNPLSQSFYVDLTHGGTRVNGTEVIVLPTQLTLGSDTVTYTTGAVAPSGNLGIILHANDATNVGPPPPQILVDNVSLTSESVSAPEPASVGLLALGGLMLTRRRRR